ncbi:polyprenyl synthetase family protein [Georgenia sp. TF02-10]|uniref:polyprenyl synthetase family protein n=1 Tax=Georgenia sp. TF02-10 TaxID=2917725 RepID=UPI001FA7D2B0|nr:polyprenyl synthetase family protein [Georgenia sp. TF02-10]UNX53401.1 polyprenyl synthetase family protein [Georgenia sp. TF02-10]
MPTAPLADLCDRVAARVQAALSELSETFGDVDGPLAEFVQPARDLLSGGKRLRAQLCAAGWLAADAAEYGEPVVLAGSALELFQATALVHDDVIDDSLTRRGMPAAHRHFAAQHAERSWLGSPESYGQAAAIVLGDLLLGASAMELERARDLVPAAAARRARDIYDVMTSQVALGQYLDIRAQDIPWGEVERPIDDALTVIRHKSASYSVQHPLTLGAALGGADQQVLDLLAAVGGPLGVAFQLRDDELGVFGDPGLTGKPAGDDLREGKRTVLLALALERADDQGRARLRQVGSPHLGPTDMTELQDLILGTGAVAAHEELIQAYREQALSTLDGSALPPAAVAVLGQLADALTRRHA